MQAESGVHTPALFGDYGQAMRMTRFLCALACFAGAAAAPAAAQPGERQGQSAARGEEWYRGQLVELAEVLGGAHFLRILCEGRDDQRWRDYMRRVIEREPNYRGNLIDGFNRGYRAEELRFRDCDAEARQTEAELRARGLRVARALSARRAQ